MSFADVAMRSLRRAFEYRAALFRALALPVTLLLVVEAIDPGNNPVLGGLAFLASLILQTSVAISTHRIILLGPGAVPRWGLKRWSMRETFFSLHVLLLAAISAVVLVLFSSLSIAGSIAGLFLVIWLTSRLSLAFPGIAVDKAVTFKESWRMTRKRQLFMFLVVSVFPFVAMILAVLLVFLPAGRVMLQVGGSIALVLTVSVLSEAYRSIIEETYGA